MENKKYILVIEDVEKEKLTGQAEYFEKYFKSLPKAKEYAKRLILKDKDLALSIREIEFEIDEWGNEDFIHDSEKMLMDCAEEDYKSFLGI